MFARGLLLPVPVILPASPGAAHNCPEHPTRPIYTGPRDNNFLETILQFAEVAVDFPDDRLRTFTYSVPEGMGIVAGDLVRVPFGPRTLQGVVFELPDVPLTELDKIRQVTARTVDGPFIAEHMLRVARWVAGHYRTSLFTACSLLLPPGASSRLRTWLTSAERPLTGETSVSGETPEVSSNNFALSRREQQAIDHVREGGRLSKSRVARSLGLGGTAIVDRLVRRGALLAESVWEKPRVSAVFTKKIELAAPPHVVSRLIELHNAKPTRATKSKRSSQRRGELLKWFQSGHTAATKKTLNEQFGAAAVKWAFGETLLETQKIRRDRDPLAEYFFQQEFAHTPTDPQKIAIDAIVGQVLAAGPSDNLNERQFLLHGVTGSGKTEVYLQAIAACIAAGKSAIYLVPEIALTPQTLQRIAARFPGKVAMLHSGLTVGQRYDQWWRVKNGDFPIVLGSRGAIFAPVEDIGLIVIDEEHEWTYKQGDQAPRYHARAVAERISAETGATLVTGSATPEITSYRAAKSGRYQLLELPDRVGHTGRSSNVGRSRASWRAPAMPAVQIVDMRDEHADGHFEMLSRTLIDSMRDALADGGRVILFINRRGTASFVQCVECGNVRQCRRCDTALTYHRTPQGPSTPQGKTASRARKGKLVCHYCNYTVGAGRACPTCGGKQMHRSSPGTEMAARTVGQYFPGIEVIRWDSDSARTAADHKRIMDEFVSGSAKVLVGTQMVAKGLDIPSVTLVGVISADTGLAAPDFRAAERAFQVLAQVVGRTGRGTWGGRAVIQTFNPDHYAIQAAADHDYALFYDTEIRLRAAQANPPFTNMIKLMHSARNAGVARTEADRLATELNAARETHGETSIEVIGPTPAYPLKVRNLYRWQILLKGPHPARLLEIVPTGALWTVDVDPGSLG
ncbi:MAG: primosomal protein N' [Chloroflexi bacterium]|nr:primosomal protein N' [Chloroflexota bacterium]